MASMIPAAHAISLQSLVTPTEGGIVSRVLTKAPGGSLTLFAFELRPVAKTTDELGSNLGPQRP